MSLYSYIQETECERANHKLLVKLIGTILHLPTNTYTILLSQQCVSQSLPTILEKFCCW